jgi:hypothetical protein
MYTQPVIVQRRQLRVQKGESRPVISSSSGRTQGEAPPLDNLPRIVEGASDRVNVDSKNSKGVTSRNLFGGVVFEGSDASGSGLGGLTAVGQIRQGPD